MDGEAIRYRELPHHEDVSINVFEFLDIENVKAIGQESFGKAMNKLDGDAFNEFGLTMPNFLRRISRMVAEIEKRGISFAKLHSATLERGINLKVRKDYYTEGWSTVIASAEKIYAETIPKMTRYFTYETHKEFEDTLIFLLTQLFRAKPYDGKRGQNSEGKGGYGDSFSAFRKKLFSMPPKKAVAALFQAQKSNDSIIREHFNYFISDLKDIYHDRLYAHGAGIILDAMHQEERFPDATSYLFNRRFLHRPQKFAAYILPVFHPIRHFIFFSHLFFDNTKNHILHPKSTEGLVKFLVSMYSIGNAYRYAVFMERDHDKERKKNKGIRFHGLFDNLPANPKEEYEEPDN
jgi:hypothetical protein